MEENYNEKLFDYTRTIIVLLSGACLRHDQHKANSDAVVASRHLMDLLLKFTFLLV
jgi:hypothetical protein